MWCLSAARGLGPDELLLLVNANSPRSMLVANEYRELRGIPPENIVYLSLPDTVLDPRAECSASDFARYIWEPANEVIAERGLQDRVLAWVYSADFPIRITTSPPMSIQGITFLRNQVPAAEIVQKGQYSSPLFAGPSQPQGPVAESRSFRWFRDMMKSSMPLPSMMLSFVGSRGTDVETALQGLRRGAASDFTRPTGTVFFVVNNDVRSRCRDWQYPAAVAELDSLGVGAKIVAALPEGQTGILGYMTGDPWPLPLFGGNAYLPGCMAEHLTSGGAIFHDPYQTKLTAWLIAGATASDGTVSEPLAIWTKFPAARFYVHHAAGCTIIESYFQAIRCPLQVLLVGDPLARPSARRLTAHLERLPADAGSRQMAFKVTAEPELDDVFAKYRFTLDGKAVPADGNRPVVEIDGAELSDGHHLLQASVSSSDLVERRAVAQAEFLVAGKGRKVEIVGTTRDAKFDLYHPATLHLRVDGDEPGEIRIVCQGRVVASVPGSSRAFRLDPSQVGQGRVVLQASAVYTNGTTVASKPITVTVAPLNRPPVIEAVQQATTSGGGVNLEARVSDPDGDAPAVDWLQPLLPGALAEKGPWGSAVSGGSLSASNGMAVLAPASGTVATCTVRLPASTPLREVQAEFCMTPGHATPLLSEVAGVVFNFRNEDDFCFFGVTADTSAWTMGEYRKGELRRVVSRGTPFSSSTWYAISVREEAPGTLVGTVGGKKVCTWSAAPPLRGSAGWLALGRPVSFQRLDVAPPVLPAGLLHEKAGTLQVDEGRNRPPLAVICRASDGSETALQSVSTP
ncbi:MAG: TIGR03790 family protein [Verrucomicrobiota bacterium]